MRRGIGRRYCGGRRVAIRYKIRYTLVGKISMAYQEKAVVSKKEGSNE